MGPQRRHRVGAGAHAERGPRLPCVGRKATAMQLSIFEERALLARVGMGLGLGLGLGLGQGAALSLALALCLSLALSRSSAERVCHASRSVAVRPAPTTAASRRRTLSRC